MHYWSALLIPEPRYIAAQQSLVSYVLVRCHICVCQKSFQYMLYFVGQAFDGAIQNCNINAFNMHGREIIYTNA